MSNKSNEEEFKALTQIEHILLRPDSYVGNIEQTTENMYVYDEQTDKIIKEFVTFSPGLLKIVDEILVNARDHSVSNINNKCDMIEVEINAEYMKVSNNGKGITIEKFKTEIREGMNEKEKEEMQELSEKYIPELIFGRLLTSTNYDDTEKRVTGGENGLGAELANIYSEKFIIETITDGVKYTQTFENNMSITNPPKINKINEKDKTTVIFYPDWEKFNQVYNEDLEMLLYKRIYDIAGTTKNIKVKINGEFIKENNFKNYIMEYNFINESELIHFQSNERWEVGVYFDINVEADNISFVNGINTYMGGKHVSHVYETICEDIEEQQKKKAEKLTTNKLKENIVLFINSVIENPDFTSQTKETLENSINSFGSEFETNELFIENVLETNILEYIIEQIEQNEQLEIMEIDEEERENADELTNIIELEDAQHAGTKHRLNCVLILTEGDSAKSLAESGISELGNEERNYIGIFPLKGKLLNVREISANEVLENEEIESIEQILGLVQFEEYDASNLEELRYGEVIIFTDQDYDGYHIEGLIINFFDVFWPELLELGYVSALATPVVKLFSNGESREAEHTFYNLNDYEDWLKDNVDNRLILKYYEGLGSSTAEEGYEYFADYEEEIMEYILTNIEDENSIELGFDEDLADDREIWISQYNPENCLTYEESQVSLTDFINEELIHFSNESVYRAIPNLIDGLEPTQREILYTGFEQSEEFVNDFMGGLELPQFCGLVAELTCYHNGDVSLISTLIGMAQNYPTSNNINYFYPSGQFGTRNEEGEDHAQARYISTCLNKISEFIFRHEDECILTHLEEDNEEIEPEFFIPILPAVLINGAEGIGTGFSTYIPQFNPIDLINFIENELTNEPNFILEPWYRGFKGSIDVINNYFINNGVISNVRENIGEVEITITEIPLEFSREQYEQTLSEMEEEELIIHFIDNSSPIDINFVVFLDSDVYFDFSKNEEDLYEFLELHDSEALHNMELYVNCEENIIEVESYNNVVDIIDDYFTVRIVAYEERISELIEIEEEEIEIIKNRIIFIRLVIDEKLLFINEEEDNIILQIKNHEIEEIDDNFDYIFNFFNIEKMTNEEIIELQNEFDDLVSEIDDLERTTPTDVWLEELHELESEFDNFFQYNDVLLNEELEESEE